MKAEILMLLRQQQDYVSGQELCERYGVSRTAIWKAIGQLKKEGYRIEAVRNKGYRLLAVDDTSVEEIYGQNELVSRMNTKWVGHPLYYYDTVDSTNLLAKRMGEDNQPHGTLLVADRQTAGRGRRGRVWDSPSGANIYYTLLLRPQIEVEQAPMLTLVMALAVAKGIQEVLPAYADRVKIKWPNDIVIEQKKVCGILTEMSLSVEQGTIQHVVIGVGINVKSREFPPELADKATSLCSVCGEAVSRTALLVSICRHFEIDYDAFLETGNLARFQQSYTALLVNCDREVCVLEPGGAYNGVARGIDACGRLLVECPDGKIKTVFAGEVSVRGIYGYV